MSLSSGTRLGPYQILTPLGAGGMGEVYRARDSKLHRDVAIKILPEVFARDAERLARFTREAQTLAALNHPNIAHIHGLEESAGVRGLVMELVDGEDLSARIARGPIPLDESLPIAKQIAEALEAAHEQGIIHRDLKPANIKVRADGTVKVLDFGLAKAIAGAAEARLRQPSVGRNFSSAGLQGKTRPTPSVRPFADPHEPAMLTSAGIILGTAAYMAPEQARGKPVDKRADIWAFGVVLFEMLSGRPLFPGETVSDTVAAVLTRESTCRAIPRFDSRACPRPSTQMPRSRSAQAATGNRRGPRRARRSLSTLSPVAGVASAPRPGWRMWVAAVGVSLAIFAGGWLVRPVPGPEKRGGA